VIERLKQASRAASPCTAGRRRKTQRRGGRRAARGRARRISAGEIAALTNAGWWVPRRDRFGVAPLDRAGPDDLSFLAAKRYLQYFQQSSAAIVLCKPDLVPEDAASGGAACRIVVRDRTWRCSRSSRPLPEPAWSPGSPTAVIGEGVVWQSRWRSPYAVLGRACSSARNVRIGAAAVLATECARHDVQLLPHVVCYSGTVVGSRVILHAVSGSARMASATSGKTGRCRARCAGGRASSGRRGDRANTTIDRGSVDDTWWPWHEDRQPRQIGHNCRIGARCLIAGQAGIAGSRTSR